MDEDETKFVLRLKLGSKLWEKSLDFLPPIGTYVVPFDHNSVDGDVFIVSSYRYYALENVCEVDLSIIDASFKDSLAALSAPDTNAALIRAGWYEVNVCAN